MNKKFAHVMRLEEEPETSKNTIDQDHVVTLGHEKNRLEREIELLKAKYADRQRMFGDLEKEFSAKTRADVDKVNQQLVENRAKEDRLNKTQSEVNKLKADIEKSAQDQKDLLMKKEVELDKALEDVKMQKMDLAKRLGHKKEDSNG